MIRKGLRRVAALVVGPWSAPPRRAGNPAGDRVIEAFSALLGLPDTLHPDGGPRALPGLEERVTAEEAYLCGIHLVALARHCRHLREEERSGGLLRLNRMLWRTGRDRSLPAGGMTPKANALYGSGLFDIADDPTVIMVPEIADRGWSIHGHDGSGQWWFLVGDRFVHSGSRQYLIVGPAWSGARPRVLVESEVIPSRSNFLGIVSRVALRDGSDAEMAAGRAVANGITISPLSDWLRDHALREKVCAGVTVASASDGFNRH